MDKKYLINKLSLDNNPVLINELIEKKQNMINKLNFNFDYKLQKLAQENNCNYMILNNYNKSSSRSKTNTLKGSDSNFDNKYKKINLLPSINGSQSKIHENNIIVKNYNKGNRDGLSKVSSVPRFRINKKEQDNIYITQLNKSNDYNPLKLKHISQFKALNNNYNDDSEKIISLPVINSKRLLYFKKDQSNSENKDLSSNEENNNMLLDSLRNISAKNSLDKNMYLSENAESKSNYIDDNNNNEIATILNELSKEYISKDNNNIKSRNRINKNLNYDSLESNNSKSGTLPNLNKIYKSCTNILKTNEQVSKAVSSSLNFINLKIKKFQKDFLIKKVGDIKFTPQKHVFIYGNNDGKYMNMEPLLKNSDILLNLNDKTAFRTIENINSSFNLKKEENSKKFDDLKYKKVENILNSMNYILEKHSKSKN